MKDSRPRQWLRQQLPELVRAGVITAETATRLRDYYSAAPGGNRRRLAMIAFGVLGALLMGLGIILLVAHNWEEFSRSTRTVLALLPLLAGQAVAAWALRQPETAVAWREGAAAFLTLAVGAALALVAQTYHISGDPPRFFLTWMLLSLPLVYLLHASLTALLYWCGALIWAGLQQEQSGHAVLFWLLLAGLLPHYWQVLTANRLSGRAVILLWGAALAFPVALGLVMEHVLPGLWIVVYAGLFGTCLAIDEQWRTAAPVRWQQPLRTVGAAGSVVLSFMLTYDWPWERTGWQYFRTGPEYHALAAWGDYVLALGLVALPTYVLIRRARHLTVAARLFLALPATALLVYLITSAGAHSDVALAGFNLYLFALGLAVTVTGIRERRLGTLNTGMLILAALVIARFFDSELGFLVRGVAFIVLGLVFLATNWIILRHVQTTQ